MGQLEPPARGSSRGCLPVRVPGGGRLASWRPDVGDNRGPGEGGRPCFGERAASRPISALEGTDGLFGDGGVLAYGAAQFLGSPTSVDVAAPVVAMAATPDGDGYWLVSADGGVYHYGDAAYYGSTGGLDLYAPIIDIAGTPDGRGYWLVGADGGVFTFGDAGYFGSTGKLRLRRPIVGFASTADGKGYWLVTDYGGVYAFGDAHYYGSLGATNLHSNPVVAIAATADGSGYWLAQGGGEVHPYGDAPRLGGMRGHPPVDGMARSPDGHGYWLVCDNGEVDSFGDASNLGGNSGAVPTPPISGIVADGAAQGYWLLDSEAFRVSLKHPGPGRGARIVKMAASQVGQPRRRRLLQPLRTLRGVVRPVRHLGLAKRWHRHPALRLRGRRLLLGCAVHASRPGVGQAGPWRPGPLRDGPARCGRVPAHGRRGAGLAGRRDRYR